MTLAVRVDAIPHRTAAALVRDYIALTKPRVVVLLEITAVAAMVMANRGWPDWSLVAATVLGGWLAAAGANAVNCWFDRDIDSAMGRTRNRPLPAGRIEPGQALGFGLALAAASFVLLATAVNLLAASLTMAAFLFYVLVYTMWLKRSSMQNIVIGGAAGAIPPLVGWAAVQGRLTLTALFLFAIIFYWTPPHFWALALLIRGDYQRAGERGQDRDQDKDDGVEDDLVARVPVPRHHGKHGHARPLVVATNQKRERPEVRRRPVEDYGEQE